MKDNEFEKLVCT